MSKKKLLETAKLLHRVAATPYRHGPAPFSQRAAFHSVPHTQPGMAQRRHFTSDAQTPAVFPDVDHVLQQFISGRDALAIEKVKIHFHAYADNNLTMLGGLQRLGADLTKITVTGDGYRSATLPIAEHLERRALAKGPQALGLRAASNHAIRAERHYQVTLSPAQPHGVMHMAILAGNLEPLRQKPQGTGRGV